MKPYTHVPGRGLVTPKATRERQEFLQDRGYTITALAPSSLQLDDLSGNIESYVGSVEVPVGLVGPLLWQNQPEPEWVYAPAGTLEGALVASMNRGARVVSSSGGFISQVHHQRMVRCPMLLFDTPQEAQQFQHWIVGQIPSIRQGPPAE
ncbi:MAG: hypothetical protein AAFQ98_22925, partial [Bacteroidota bacterium]